MSFPAPLAAVGLLLTLLVGCASQPLRGLADPVEPLVQNLVSEDDQVRITELRVRGQTQRISVQPKGNAAPAYEVNPPAAGSDPSKARDGAGQRVWPLLRF